jgi:hypothetical protein
LQSITLLIRLSKSNIQTVYFDLQTVSFLFHHRGCPEGSWSNRAPLQCIFKHQIKRIFQRRNKFIISSLKYRNQPPDLLYYIWWPWVTWTPTSVLKSDSYESTESNPTATRWLVLRIQTQSIKQKKIKKEQLSVVKLCQ